MGVNGADADAAYSAFLTFKDVVKKNQVASAGASATVPSGDKIGEAAKKAFGCFLPILEGNRLDLRPLDQATPWCFSLSGPEGRGQGDRDGKCHGWKPPQGSSRSPPQGHRQHRWQRCDISGRLRGGERG